jgi:hypothetical protein
LLDDFGEGITPRLRETRAVERGILIAVWVTLPITAGSAAAEAIDGWSTAPEITAAALGWTAWTAALLAIIIPHPLGLTALRSIVPLFAALAVVVVVFGDVGAVSGALATAATLTAAVLAARPAIAYASANSVAYGDEERFPLHIPPALFLGPLPLARLLLGAAVMAGPLLLADERWAAGAAALAVGVPLAVVASRALHSLSTRWVVLVPAGFVVVDPLTLADPVLFVREHIVTLRAAEARAPAGDRVLDLRLGATIGTLALSLDKPAEIFRAPRARRGVVTVHASDIRVSVVRRDDVLVNAAARRIPVQLDAGASPVQAAMPPPTSTSPS